VPDLDDDERLVIGALARRGISAAPATWDDPSVHWAHFGLVVVRSTWDYDMRRDAFLTWARSLRLVFNSADVLGWNTDKRYLRHLAERGIPVVPTTWIDDAAALATIDLPRGEYVVKPVISAGSRNTARYDGTTVAEARALIAEIVASGRGVMVQPYVRSIDSAGETGLVYIDGVFSHAIRKGAILRSTGRTTTQQWEPEEITPRTPGADERRVGDAALDALPWPRADLLYARVDIVRSSSGEPMVIEVELTEPSLYLGCGEGAAERLAAGIARRTQSL
jgi:hypothetical protein